MSVVMLGAGRDGREEHAGGRRDAMGWGPEGCLAGAESSPDKTINSESWLGVIDGKVDSNNMEGRPLPSFCAKTYLKTNKQTTNTLPRCKKLEEKKKNFL